MALDDETIQQVEKEFRTLTKQIFQTNRAQKSSIATIVRGTRSRIEQQKIITAYKKELNKVINSLDSTNEAHQKRIALYKKEIRETNKLSMGFTIVRKAVGFVAKALTGLSIAVLKTAQQFMDAGKETKTFTQAGQAFADQLTGPGGTALAKFLSTIDFNIQNFQTLSKQGADFGQSLFGLRQAATAANMPIMDFVDLIQGNTEGLAKFFGTTQRGTPRIAELTREVRDFTRDEMSRFGLTMDDTANYMTSYLEIMRSQGRAENMTQAQLIAGSQNYIKELITLSKLTGQSTDDLNAQLEQQKQNGVLAAALAKRSPEEAERLSKFVASLGGPTTAAGGLATDLIAAGAPITDISQRLAGVNSDLLDALQNFINNPAADIEDTISNVRQASNQLLKDFPQAAAYFQGEFVDILGNAAALAGADTGGAIGKEVAKVIGDPGADFTKAAMRTKDSFDQISVKGEALVTSFVTSAEGLNKATGFLDEVNKKVFAAIGKADEYMENVGGDAGKKTLSLPKMLEDLKKVFSDVKEKMLGAITTAYSSMVQSLKSSYKAIKIAIQNGLIKTYNALIKILPESVRPQAIGYVGEGPANPNLRAGTGSGTGQLNLLSPMDAGEFTGLSGGAGPNQIQANEFSDLVPPTTEMQRAVSVGPANPNLRAGTSTSEQNAASEFSVGAAGPEPIVKALEETNRLFSQLIALSGNIAKNTKDTSMNLKKTGNVMEG
tara:strand:+ start:2420 stop:4585 length:2166 start_codon:yes stop_codon:yes gene_type:complete